MRYFLITSLMLHGALFAVWTSQPLIGHKGNPVTLSLLIDNEVIDDQQDTRPPVQQFREKHARQDTTSEGQETRPASSSSSAADEMRNNHKLVQHNTTGISDKGRADIPDNTNDNIQHSRTSPQLDHGAQVQAYLKDVFVPYFSYPRLAQQKGWQGTVELAVRIDSLGKLTRVRIVHSSGYGILDYAAVHSVRRVKTLPNAAQWLDNHGLEVNFPVKYQLIDS